MRFRHLSKTIGPCIGLLLLVLSSALANADSVGQSYIDERARILDLPYDSQLTALAESRVFDRSTVLGEYFYQNTYYWGTEDRVFFGLQGADREKLKQQHPYFYVDMLLEEVNATADNSPEQYLEVMGIAKQFGFYDIAFEAADLASNKLFMRGKIVGAIAVLESVIHLPTTQSEYLRTQTPTIEDIFRRLANVYMLLDEFDAALKFCEKLSNTNDVKSLDFVSAQLCKANAYYYSGNPQRTLDIVYPILESEGKHLHYTINQASFWLVARANNQLGLYEEALEFGLQALELNDEPTSISLVPGLFLTEIVMSYVGLGDKKNAAHYAALLEEPIKLHSDVPLTYRKFLVAKSLNQELQGDYQGAHATLTEILEIDETLKRLNANRSSVVSTVNGLSQNRVQYLETIAAEAEAHQQQRNLAIALSLLFCSLCLFIYWRKQNKLKSLAHAIERDASTGLYSYGFSLLALADAIDTPSSTPTTLALLKVGNLSLAMRQKGEDYANNSLIGIAKHLKSTLPDSFTIGRYSQDTFIVVFPKTYAKEAELILRDAIKPYAADTQLYSSSITLSAGVLEITKPLSLDYALERCEALLPNSPSPTEFVIHISTNDMNVEAVTETVVAK